MTVRAATTDDLDALCSIAGRFAGEATIPLIFDPTLARSTLWVAISHPDTILLVWESNGVLGGAILGFVEQDFFKESLAYVSKLYVEREFRGLGASRELVEAFERRARELGAQMVFASSVGMPDLTEKLYVRLFEKRGYNVVGKMLSKEI